MSIAVLAALVVVFSLVMYVLLEGFDLGVGILLLTSRDQAERDEMVESIAPVWDGNETWLILLGVTLLAAFPLAYSTVLPANYLPVLVMLMALGFRGVSFEFRFQTDAYRKYWDIAFGCGSAIAAFCQGLILGTALNGLVPAGAHEPAGTLSFLSTFSILTGAATIVAYTLLGATWLHWRSEGVLQSRIGAVLHRVLPLFAILASLSVATMTLQDNPAGTAWREHSALFSGFGVLAAILLVLCWRAVGTAPGHARAYATALLALFLVGIVIIVWPHIVPYSITIEEASSPSGSQLLLLTGVAFMVPVVLGNGIYVYWIFRRKPKNSVEDPRG